MKILHAVLVATLTATLGLASDLSVEVDGKTFTVKRTPLNHGVTEKDKAAGGQTTPMACSFLYYTRLAQGDIPGAAALTTDPKAKAEEWQQLQARNGGPDALKKMAEGYFSSKKVIIEQLAMGDEVLLIVRSTEYTAGQMYVNQGNKWLMTDSPSPDTGKVFGKILSMIQDGTYKP